MKSSQLPLPPYGRELQARIKFKNPPFMAAICVGASAWENAKAKNDNKDWAALILPEGKKPESYLWPVKGIDCVIEWDIGPNEALIINMIKTLFKAGAPTVTVRPLFVDKTKPAFLFDANTQKFQQIREMTRVYRNSALIDEVCNVA
jgi:hypothetical protein